MWDSHWDKLDPPLVLACRARDALASGGAATWPEALVWCVAIVCATFLLWRGAAALYRGW